jgi:hypothetical protein
MTERDACKLLKARFEQAGYHIAENVALDEDGLAFEVDGFDAARRVGYEYITEEAGDSWDVDASAITARRDAGLFVLVVDEKDAPDATKLGAAADLFLAQLPPLAKKPPPIPNKAATKKPAAKKGKKR